MLEEQDELSMLRENINQLSMVKEVITHPGWRFIENHFNKVIAAITEQLDIEENFEKIKRLQERKRAFKAMLETAASLGEEYSEALLRLESMESDNIDNMSDQTTDETVSEDTANSEEVESTNVEASDGSQDASEEASAEKTDETSEEWLVPGRFRTVEDLKRSYSHLEAEHSRRGNELYELRKRASQSTEQRIDPKERIERFAEEVKRDPVEAIERIIDKKTQGIREEQAQREFASEYTRLMQNKEFADLEPTMVNLTQQLNPFLTDAQKRDPQLLHWLYYTAKGIKSDEARQAAERKGAQKGAREEKKKQKIVAEGASGSKGHVKRPFSELSREEMKAEIAKGRLYE